MSVTVDTTNALITLDGDALNYFGVPVADDDQVQKLNALINAFSEMFNRETRRLIKSRTLTEYYDGDGTNILLVDNYPITTLTKLYIDSSRVFAASSEIVAADYLLYGTAGKVVVPDYSFPLGFRTVKIVYVGGYLTIPWAVQNAAREFVKWAWKRDEANAIGISAMSMTDQNVTFQYEKLPSSVQRVIDNYRRPHGYVHTG